MWQFPSSTSADQCYNKQAALRRNLQRLLMRVVCNIYDCMLRDRFQCAERNWEIARVTDCKPEIRCLTAAVPEVCNKTVKTTKKNHPNFVSFSKCRAGCIVQEFLSSLCPITVIATLKTSTDVFASLWDTER